MWGVCFVFFFSPSLLFPAFSQCAGAGGGLSPNPPLALMCAPVDDILCQAPLSAPRLAQGICSPCLLLPGGRKRHHPCFKSRNRQSTAFFIHPCHECVTHVCLSGMKHSHLSGLETVTRAGRSGGFKKPGKKKIQTSYPFFFLSLLMRLVSPMVFPFSVLLLNMFY